MPNRRYVIESKCDRSRYRVSLDPDAVIVSVTYRHFAGRYEKLIPQRVEEATMDYYRALKTDGAPETEGETYWFVRACYEHHKKPFWAYFKPTQTLVIVPPAPDDGSLISIMVDEPPEEIAPVIIGAGDCEKKESLLQTIISNANSNNLETGRLPESIAVTA